MTSGLPLLVLTALAAQLGQTAALPTAQHIDERAVLGPAITPVGTSIAGYTAIGCYQDTYNTNAQILSVYQYQPLMTIESCAAFCKKGSYTYMGVSNGQWCYCDNQINLRNGLGYPTSSDLCAVPCVGNLNQNCGSFWTNSMFMATDKYNAAAASSSSAAASASQFSATSAAAASSLASSISASASAASSLQASISASASRASSLAASASVAQSISASAAAASSYQASLAASASVAQSISASAAAASSYQASLAASASVAQSLAASASVAQSIAASASASASRASSLAASASVAQSLAASASVAQSLAASASVAQSIAASASVAQSLAASASVAASLAASASVAQSLAASASVAQSLAASASVAQSLAASASVAQSIAQSAVASASAASSRSAAAAASSSAAAAAASSSSAAAAAASASSASSAAAAASSSSAAAAAASASSASAAAAASSSSAAAAAAATATPSPWVAASASCVAEGASGRALTGAQTSGPDMTYTKCLNFCNDKGFAIAGLEYSSECYCGNALVNGASLSQTSGQCNMACSGSPTKTCGGPDALTVFVIPSKVSSLNSDLTVKAASLPDGWSAASTACVAEGNNGRALTGAATAADDMTPAKCSSFCGSRGFKYAGVEYSSECYCGNSFDNGASLDKASNACNMACSGDKNTMCGGPGALNVFTNPSIAAPVTDSKTPVSSGSLPSGWAAASSQCIQEVSGRALTGASIAGNSMTVSTCLSFCQNQGFSYAGLEYGQECYCGNALSNGADLSKTSGQCNMACAADSTSTCGGPNAIQLYTNAGNAKANNPAPVVVGGYQSSGCIQEVAGRALTGLRVDYADMTIDKCTAACKNAGFTMAGVEYGQECYCGNSLVNGASLSQTSGQCYMDCPGNAGQKCGGPNAIQLYTAQ